MEYWDAGRAAWIAADPQLDETMIRKCRIAFDPLDLPPGAFLPGPAAWLACRAGADPGNFGIFELSGMDFVKGDFILDLAALGGRELQPWDYWGLMERPAASLGPAELAALDGLARRLPLGAELGVPEARALAEGAGLALPRRIKSWQAGAAREVDLGAELG